jgi:hypothetical protein
MGSHEEDPVAPTRAGRARRSISLLVRIVAGLIGLAIIAFGVFIIVFITHYGNGDSPYSGIFVNNRTQFNLTIYLHMQGQELIPAARVPGHSRVGTDITCGSQEMTAEDAAGHVIARRGPLPACDESEWVISETSSLEDPSSVAG